MHRRPVLAPCLRHCLALCWALLAPFLAIANAQSPEAREPAAAPRAQQPARGVADVRSRAQAQAMAAKVDRLLADAQRRAGVTPLPRVDDATFVRRAYLQIAGRIPNLEECETFLADQAPDKRAALVDRLLDSPGYTSHQANWWFDLLRVTSRLRQVSGEPFAHWLRQAVIDDLPYDELVRRLLTASGPAQQRGNGATGYLLRDANMPHDAMANTLRLFLGTRLECAQCHNHPFDTWTQQEFYGMAAFFGGLRYRADTGPVPAAVRQALQGGDDRTRALARRTLQVLSAGLAGNGTGVERLPADYKYDDAAPRSPVFASTIFGADVTLQKVVAGAARERRAARGRPVEVESRRALADWLTAPDNPRFAKVAVGRTWQRLFGRGLIEPVDDLRADCKAVYPELQAHLERLLVELRFDLRQFQRVLLLTDLFQREAVRQDPAPDRPFAFEGPLLRRMSAEQTWDSLLTLVFADVDDRLRAPDARAAEVYDRYEQLAGMAPQELATLLQDPQRMLAQERERRLQQQAAQRPFTPEQQQQIRTLRRQLATARRQDDRAAVDRLLAQLASLGAPAPGQRAQRGREGDLLRASDLAQPAPPSHLLRQFGQSDRETVDAATTAATVPQALTLMNGFLDQRVLNGDSSLRSALQQAGGPAAKVRAAFVCVLSRAPDAAEAARWKPLVASGGEDALRDLVWVLCNGNEFRFLR